MQTAVEQAEFESKMCPVEAHRLQRESRRVVVDRDRRIARVSDDHDIAAHRLRVTLPIRRIGPVAIARRPHARFGEQRTRQKRRAVTCHCALQRRTRVALVSMTHVLIYNP